MNDPTELLSSIIEAFGKNKDKEVDMKKLSLTLMLIVLSLIAAYYIHSSGASKEYYP